MRTPLLISLFLIPLAACAPPKTTISISFVPHWDGVPLVCGSGDIQLTDLRFYVSELQLFDSKGSATAAQFLLDKEWQSSDVAMIDLEDGQGGCVNGSSEQHTTMQATVAKGEYERLGFTLGVPFELNHANPLTAVAPLDDAAMHWHWRSGYKFLRAGFKSADAAFWIHLGSTGCKGTVQNITQCTSPNRVKIDVAAASLPDLTIGIDLARLFAEVDGSDCSSGPAESACAAPFNALGLSHQQPATDSQYVFTLRP